MNKKCFIQLEIYDLKSYFLRDKNVLKVNNLIFA